MDVDNTMPGLSGYFILDEHLIIGECSGQLEEMLRTNELKSLVSFTQVVNSLNKKLKHFFESEIIPAISSKKIRHFVYERKKTNLLVFVTPIEGGRTILSLEESPDTHKLNLQALPDQLQEVLIRVNPDLQVIYTSQNFRSIFKEKASFVTGKTLEESGFFKDKTPEIAELVSKSIQNHKQKETLLDLMIGTEKTWWNIFALPDTDPVTGMQSVLIFLKDITKYKTVEEKLTESETRYEMATEAADVGIWDYIVTEGKTFYSRRWKSMLGYYPDELRDEFSVWEDLLHPDDKDRMLHQMDNFIKSDLLLYEAEFRLRHKNGSYIWIKSRATALRNENGKVVRIIGTHFDISREKKSANELKKLNQAILQSPIMVAITDTKGFIEFCNPAFCKVTGWTDQEILGKKTNILKSGFHTMAFYEKLWRTIGAGNEWQGEFKNRKKNGEFYWELASISPIRNDFGTVTNYVKIAENISYLKKIEKDLKKAKLDAETANKYKNHFLANMSHEIRTPINTIIGFSELIKNENLPAQKRAKYTGIIEENSQSLLRLIDDIIDVSKIEANELKIKKEACSLEELFSELEMTYNNFLKRRDKHRIEINFQIPEEAHHDVIFTDPYRLKQILNNLFINAMNYTDRGQIEVGYAILNESRLQFFVSDTGSGIPAARIKDIFKRFTYNEETGVSDQQNSGLGLSISRDLAVLLGGDISVKSVEGKGSIFYVTLPYDKIKVPLVRQPSRPAPVSKFNFSDFTIMVAEDTPYNYEYLSSILQRTGAKIIWAKDGIDVLKMFNSDKVDLILMDIQLPEISGYEATSQIREKNKNIPIIAQTAYAMAEDRQKCMEAGCNDVLVKPIRMDDVLNTVAKYLMK